jgi:hypothetical protein
MHSSVTNTLAVLGAGLFLAAGAGLWRELGGRAPGEAPAPAAALATLVEDVNAGVAPEAAPGVRQGRAKRIRGTVYYTPRESGFGAEQGFDMTPVTKPGLKGRTFPRDFLKAVQLEGFGLMKEPVDGCRYLSTCGGKWAFAKAPLDRHGEPLQPLRSAAVSAATRALPHATTFAVTAANELPAAFSQARWKVCDTGGGLAPDQIDFYWGEDDPLGPGAQLSRPRGMPMRIVNSAVVVLR